MTALFPVAPTAEAALHAPEGFAARESEARVLAGGDVRLASEPVGPAFATREAAAQAYAPRLAESAAWCALRPVSPEGGRPPAPAKRLVGTAERWPEREPAPVLWRLQVSWWRSAPASDEPALAPARKARRAAAGAALDARSLGRLAAQPLRAVRPQQPLDVGLFEVRPPEAPDRLIADE